MRAIVRLVLALDRIPDELLPHVRLQLDDALLARILDCMDPDDPA